MRTIIVTVNGVYQQIGQDFVTKGHTIMFKNPPVSWSLVELTVCYSASASDSSITQWNGDGVRTNFPLPAAPGIRFAVITDSKEQVPDGYSVVDVDFEIESWIRDNNPISDWKWADQLDGTSLIAGGFGMVRLIVKNSIVTYIATRWSE